MSAFAAEGERVGDRTAEEIGVRAVLVHALDEQAQRFYRRFGFYESPTSDLTLMLTVEEIQRSVAGGGEGEYYSDLTALRAIAPACIKSIYKI